MRIIIRSKDVNLRLPIPLPLANAAVFLLPESAVAGMTKSLPQPLPEIITKKFLRELVQECLFILKQYRGLEIVHVEVRDGTFVSIRL